MVSRRQMLLGLGAGVIGSPFASFAQQPAPGAHRIGFLTARPRPTKSNPDVDYGAFVQGMRELGYVDRKNLVIEWRSADGKYERLPSLAAELLRMKVEVVVTQGSPATQAAQRASRTIPIVAAVVNDPIGSGFAESLARPGGNITGLSLILANLSPKHVELLKTIMPRLSGVAVLMNPGNPGHPGILKSVQSAARQIGLTVLPVYARAPDEIERGFATMKQKRTDAVVVAGDPLFSTQGAQIAELALKTRIPAITPWQYHTAAGSLMSYGQNLTEFHRRAAGYVDKILKGAKPGELPIEQPTTLHLAINRKTARALGLTIPQELLLRADEVIE
jgi:putative ABC transport system substrate-binding protein